jgi:2-iminobutanoate/2-iminopropanoate deaminase
MPSGPGGIRTPGLFSAIEARSQLRYRPVFQGKAILPDGIVTVKQSSIRGYTMDKILVFIFNHQKIKEVHVSSCKCKEIVTSQKGPKAIGPYSIGVKACKFVYTAGQIGIEPGSGELVSGGLEAETHQVLRNLKTILEAGGSDLNHVIKTTIFLQNIADFAKMNAIYAEYFTSDPPARSTIQVAALPKGAVIEIEAVALIHDENCDCTEEKKCDCH